MCPHLNGFKFTEALSKETAQRVLGNVLNVLSLTDVLRIHHFHLDRALITELCRLLNNDTQSLITQLTSLRATRVFFLCALAHPPVRLCMGRSVRNVCVDISSPLTPNCVKKKKKEKDKMLEQAEKLVF